MEIGQSYTIEQFEQDAANVKPRAFDTYILPAFMIFFAVKSKSGMNRWPRRILFTAGIYMAYRNWGQYKQLLTTVQSFLPIKKEETNETPLKVKTL